MTMNIALRPLGSICETFSAPKGYKGDVRPVKERLDLIKGHGIQGDKFAGKKPERAVMVVGTKAYELAKSHGIELAPGSLGENLLLSFDPHELALGDIITVGEAKLQITEKCSICSHLAAFDKNLPKIIAKHRGVYCKIVQNGTITKQQRVSLQCSR